MVHKFARVKPKTSITWDRTDDNFSYFKYSLHPHNGVYKRTSHRFLDSLPGLRDEVGYEVTPHCWSEDEPPVLGMATGGRTSILKDAPVHEIDISQFGWADESTIQEFKVETKGSGARNISAGFYRVVDGAPTLVFNPDGVTITRNDFDNRPYGGHNYHFAVSSYFTTQNTLDTSPVKFTPVIEVYELSDRLHEQLAIHEKLMREHLPKGKFKFYKGKVAQLKRLTPSTIRGVHIDMAKGKTLVNLVQQLGKSPEDYERLYKQLLEDMYDYARIIPTGKQIGKNKVEFFHIGDIHNIHYNDNNARGAFCYAKDMAIAPTGAYWTDLESFRPRAHVKMFYDKGETRPKDPNLQDLHMLSIANLLKDFHRMLTQYRVGCVLAEKGKASDRTKKSIEKKVWKDVVDVVHRVPGFEVEVKEFKTRKPCIIISGRYEPKWVGIWTMFIDTFSFQPRYGGLPL